MDKYLQEILKEVNTIIIPGLGALTITNKEKGEYMFMPFLKHDDGNLAKYIAQKEGWEENEAKNLIAKYVREIEAKLNVGESYDMFQFGSFKKDSSGDIEFVAWQGEVKDEAVPEKKEEPEVSEPEIIVEEPELEVSQVEPEETPEQEVESYIEEIPVDEKEEIIVEETVQVEAVIEPELPTEEESYSMPEITQEPQVAEESVDEIVADVSTGAEYTEEQQWKDDLDVPPIGAKIEKPKKPILEKAKKDRKRRPIPIFLLVFFVILVGAGTTVGLFYNEIKTALFSTHDSDTTKLAEEQFEFTDDEEQKQEETQLNTETESSVESEESTIPEETTEPEPVQAEVKTEKKKEEPKVSTAGDVDASASFHLVIGSFQNKSFADNFSAKARGEGNASSVIGPYGGFFLVSIGAYQSEQEGKSALSDKISAYPKVWLFRKP
jgi:nucleoid DNA-binding protein/cell division septation protein DedD